MWEREREKKGSRIRTKKFKTFYDLLWGNFFLLFFPICIPFFRKVLLSFSLLLPLSLTLSFFCVFFIFLPLFITRRWGWLWSIKCNISPTSSYKSYAGDLPFSRIKRKKPFFFMSLYCEKSFVENDMTWNIQKDIHCIFSFGMRCDYNHNIILRVSSLQNFPHAPFFISLSLISLIFRKCRQFLAAAFSLPLSYFFSLPVCARYFHR